VRIIPDEISVHVRSVAERRVFAALKALSDDAGVALHSVNLPDHAYKRLGEIDFVVVTPDVMLVIEVKGGPIKQSGGKWYFGGRHGPVGIKEEGPFDQARSGMHALERQLGRLIGKSRMLKVASGFFVITTDVDLPPSTEYAAETYLSATHWNGGRGLSEALRRARRFWLSRNHSADPVISSALRNEIVTAIRPDFERVPSLATRADELDARFERLTREETAFFDRVAANPRILCLGGAGSGKTFLAAEVARRRASEGRVLVTCASATLASFLHSRLSLPNITVQPFSRLASQTAEPYDLLILDEAQDLMTFDVLDTLGRKVRGGIDEGGWVIMLDPNNQRLATSRFEPDAYDYLLSVGHTAMTLPHNCRNTEQIVRQTQLQTGADIGVAKAGEGVPVTFCEVDDMVDEAKKLDRHVDDLAEEDVRPGDVTLVSMSGDWQTTAARSSKRFGRIKRLTEVVGADPWPNRITWSSVDEIKGLENRFVCIIDVDPMMLQGRLDALYVAMTRPRAGLWIACRPGVSAALTRISKVHFDGISRD
jgi:hypothetical protein